LAEAINRAGSTKPDAVQAALKATDLKAEQLMMGYKGVKFDQTGQNILASAYMIQLTGDKYIPVWPESAAQAKPTFPFKGWK
jgi:branched-chain amino acid transport system substrate-binding protein